MHVPLTVPALKNDDDVEPGGEGIVSVSQSGGGETPVERLLGIAHFSRAEKTRAAGGIGHKGQGWGSVALVHLPTIRKPENAIFSLVQNQFHM